MNMPNVDASAVKNPLSKVKFSRLERLYQTPTKWKLAFQKYKLSNSFFKMQLQNCVFPNFNLQILSSKSNLRSSFANLFNFKFSKTCWKSPKLYKRNLTHFEKMSLARWFWAFFFFWKKKEEKEVFCLVKFAKTNAFSSTGKMKADKTTKSFPTYRILAFRTLIGWSQAIKLRKREFDRLEKIWQFYQSSSCLSKKKRMF